MNYLLLYSLLVLVCLLGKEIEPKSEIRFGWGMSFEYHGQMLHGLN